MKYDLRAFQTPLKKPYEIKKAPKEGEEIIFVCYLCCGNFGSCFWISEFSANWRFALLLS